MIAHLHRKRGENIKWAMTLYCKNMRIPSTPPHQQQQCDQTENIFWAAAGLSVEDENTVTAQTEGKDAVINEEQGQSVLRGI